MTREEYVAICEKCVNRQMDFTQGLICKRTGAKADFETLCSDFGEDSTVEINPEKEDEAVNINDIHARLDDHALMTLKMEQNLPLGLVAGIIIGIVGAALWCIISVATGYQIGYMALAIGAGVGFGIRKFGKGIEPVFGILGAVIALLSCLLGNIITIIVSVAKYLGVSVGDIIAILDYNLLSNLMVETFSPVDILFYAFAVIEGYKLSFRKITERNIKELKTL